MRTPSPGRRSYLALADRLREEILSGSIPDGSLLPNERQLSERARLSRGSVREALRMLQVEGLISTRPGRNGGSVARRPNSVVISRTLSNYVRGRGISLDAVLNAREALEPALAALAATNRTDDDLKAIERAAAAMEAAGSNADFVAENTGWHLAVAAASRNPVLVVLLEAIRDLVDRSSLADVISPEVRRDVMQTHGRIEAALRERDPHAASRRMARHLASYRAIVQHAASLREESAPSARAAPAP